MWLSVDQGIVLSEERLANQMAFAQPCSLRKTREINVGRTPLGATPGEGRPPRDGVSQVARPFPQCRRHSQLIPLNVQST